MENNKAISKLNSKGKKIVEMYITARQFKNAVLQEEMIIIPNTIIGKDTVIEWGGTKITVRGSQYFCKTFPFVVNKAFACEVYLKLILIENNFDLKKMKNHELHNLFKLYQNTDNKFKSDLINFFKNKYGNKIDELRFEEEIKKISKVFIKWRYIYEQAGKNPIVNYGFLNSFCDVLDDYTKKIILDNYNYDVNEDMR